MASTYANVTVVGPDHDEVVAALGGSRGLVSETVDGVTVVFAAADEEAHAFGEGETAAALSARCRCPALEVAVYEEQVFQYRLFADGHQVDVGVVSTPLALQMAELAGGSLPDADAARLVGGLGRGDEGMAARALAPGGPFAFASERHAALAEALRLPGFAAGWGFLSVSAQPEEFEGGALTCVG